MNLKIENIDNITIASIIEMKFTNVFAADFRDRIEKLINEGNYNILVNLEKVSYMDSAGLGAIISCFNYLNDTTEKLGETGKLAICSLNSNIEFLFSMLRINGVIDIFDNRNIALIKMKPVD